MSFALVFPLSLIAGATAGIFMMMLFMQPYIEKIAENLEDLSQKNAEGDNTESR